jgi:nucleotide-binding universal stress UspA family protein
LRDLPAEDAGRDYLWGLFLGTAASKILRHAPVPVMILPRQHTSPKE